MRNILILIPLLLFQCAEKKATDSASVTVPTNTPEEKSYPVLYIKTMSTIGDVSKDSVSVVSGDYFEISISSITKNGVKTYITTRTLQRSGVGEPYVYVQISITDSKGEILKFNSSTEFLNYMSEHGYEMATQTEKKFGADYTFKRK